MHIKYLPGLDSLRFLAAFFVIISHANQSISKLGIISPITILPVFEKGGDAVNFFFTLSGFLITYLLIHEKESTGNISLKHFYLRRVFRIWPLYFIILTIGFIFFALIYPAIYHEKFFSFNVWYGLLLFVFFLSNYVSINYKVGLLNPLWSIGVEEQFYLFWAPLMKIFRNKTFKLLISFLLISTLFSFIVNYNIINFPAHLRSFFITLKFHNMAVGCMFAYILYNLHSSYCNTFLTHKISQALVVFSILYHYFIGFSFISNPFLDIFLSILYGLLILNISTIPNKLLNLEIKPLSFLGRISYGLYMYHMLVDYALRFSFSKFDLSNYPVGFTIILYHLLLLSFTILVSTFSYFYIEKYFLKLKTRFT